MNTKREFSFQEFREYQDAVWDFVMEHCDVLDSGSLFVKFHVKGRDNFENRILSRWRYGYHREDPKAKQIVVEEKKAENARIRKEKRKLYAKNRRKGRRLLLMRKLMFWKRGKINK